jgi:hypothetical protein
MTTRVGAVGRGPSIGALVEGRTDIDVMLVIAIRRGGDRKARMKADWVGSHNRPSTMTILGP